MVDRPRAIRTAARVLVKADNQVLLLRDTDPGVPGESWWFTPGGGVDEGEDFKDAAVRELREETGLEVSVEQLIGPIAHRFVVHGYSDRILEQEEYFFTVELVEQFALNHDGLTARELATIKEFAWIPVADVPGLRAQPNVLAELLRWDGGLPLELGWMEESTVAVEEHLESLAD